jgi:hypothetical protein
MCEDITAVLACGGAHTVCMYRPSVCSVLHAQYVSCARYAGASY